METLESEWLETTSLKIFFFLAILLLVVLVKAVGIQLLTDMFQMFCYIFCYVLKTIISECSLKFLKSF